MEVGLSSCHTGHEFGAPDVARGAGDEHLVRVSVVHV